MKYAFVQWIFVIAIILSSCNGFNVRSRLFMSTVAPNSLKTIQKGKIWPGNRPPVPNLQLLEQRMDATWGRGKFRTEVWEDDVNPVNFWWDAYAPSEETLEAIELGFDFMDPKGWLEVLFLLLLTVTFLIMALSYRSVESTMKVQSLKLREFQKKDIKPISRYH